MMSDTAQELPDVILSETPGDSVVNEGGGDVVISEVQPAEDSQLIAEGSGDSVVSEGSDDVIVDSPTGERGIQGIPGAQGVQGIPGAGTTLDVVAGEQIYAGQPAVIRPDGKAYAAKSTQDIDGDQFSGIATVSAGGGEHTTLMQLGEIAVPDSIPVGPVYVGTDGYITTDPWSGVMQILIGQVVTTGRLVIKPEPPVHHS